MATFSVDPTLYSSTGGVLPWPTPSPLDRFAFLRDALNSVKSTTGGNHQISLSAGSFDIRRTSAPVYVRQIINGRKVKVQTGWKLATNGAPTLARFGAKSLAMTGQTDASGRASTILTGLRRIFTGQSDRGYGIPKGWDLKNLVFSFSDGSGYILQAGETTLDTKNEIDDLTFENVVFEGSHTGAVGGNGSLPWGLYLDVRSGNPGGIPDYLGLTLDRVIVKLTGQGSGVGAFNPANLPFTAGSAFLSTQGDTITIRDSLFDESGFRNALTIKDSTNVLISGNVFTRSAFYGNRYNGEKFLNVAGSIVANKLEHGSYLELYDVLRPLMISGNDFDLSRCGGDSIVIRDNPMEDYAGIVAANIDLSGNVFRGGLVARSELVSPSQLVLRSASGVSNDVVVSSLTYTFDRFLVGGLSDDPLDGGGSGDRDWISGDAGNDTLTGGEGADAFVFATAPDTVTNSDRITDFTPGTDRIWLDDAIYTGLTPGAFLGREITYEQSSGELRFAGQVFASFTGTLKPSLTQADFVLF